MFKDAQALNARSFGQLVEAAKAHPERARTPALEVLSEFASQVDARVCERAGSCPVLLVDLNFNVPDYWNRVTVRVPASVSPGLFTQETAGPLLHEILMQAWTLTHSAPRAARLFFGLAPQVTQAIAQLTREEVERIAHERAVHLRPRWEDRDTFWRALLNAATGANDDDLVDVHLHCLSLLGGEFVPVRRTR